jgi:hypothetical protein
LYNKIHDSSELGFDLARLRELVSLIDNRVLELYNWSDIELNHGFQEVLYLPESDRLRFTISAVARSEVLLRLSRLNRQRYELELARPHDKSARSRSIRARSAQSEPAPQQGLDF